MFLLNLCFVSAQYSSAYLMSIMQEKGCGFNRIKYEKKSLFVFNVRN